MTETSREQHFAIEGMHCAGCVHQVEQQVSGLIGVEVADVNLATEQMAVRFDPAAVDEESIAAAVAEAGFRARLQAPEAEGAARRQERKRVELAAQAGAFRWGRCVLAAALCGGDGRADGPARRPSAVLGPASATGGRLAPAVGAAGAVDWSSDLRRRRAGAVAGSSQHVFAHCHWHGGGLALQRLGLGVRRRGGGPRRLTPISRRLRRLSP